MRTTEIGPVLAHLFSELVDGTVAEAGGFILNGGDMGLRRSLDKLSAAEASRSTNGGATVAAHTQHVRYGFSLMNQWADEGGNPFATAKWEEAWQLSTVDTAQWDAIRNGLRQETHRWLEVLKTPREIGEVELTGMIASVTHLAYHLGAIRQINKDARGPKEGA